MSAAMRDDRKASIPGGALQEADVEYDAFISYRHVEPDQSEARWLHGALETFRVPKSLARERSLPRRLKRVYRDILIGDRRDVRLVFLKGDLDLIARRIAARADHFMPSTLLESQFAALEVPQPDERAIVVSIAPHPREIVETIVSQLGVHAAAADRTNASR